MKVISLEKQTQISGGHNTCHLAIDLGYLAGEGHLNASGWIVYVGAVLNCMGD